MAQFNKKFGIKEVADVGFYKVGTVSVSEAGEISATAAPASTVSCTETEGSV